MPARVQQRKGRKEVFTEGNLAALKNETNTFSPQQICPKVLADLHVAPMSVNRQLFREEKWRKKPHRFTRDNVSNGSAHEGAREN